MNKGTKADRRQSRRYAVNGDIFLTFWPSLDRIGRLKDVSGGGVAFEYAVLNDKEKVADVEVNIFAAQPSNFMLWRVPCKVVYDEKIDLPTLAGIETRRCGLQFESLSKRHSELLNILLTQHISHPLPAG
jgi:hypothetical protein